MCYPPYVGMLSGVKLALYGKPHLMSDIKFALSASVRANTQ